MNIVLIPLIGVRFIIAEPNLFLNIFWQVRHHRDIFYFSNIAGMEFYSVTGYFDGENIIVNMSTAEYKKYCTYSEYCMEEKRQLADFVIHDFEDLML